MRSVKKDSDSWRWTRKCTVWFLFWKIEFVNRTENANVSWKEKKKWGGREKFLFMRSWFLKTSFEKQQYFQSGLHLPLVCALRLHAIALARVFHGRLTYPYLCKQNVLVMVPLVKSVILQQHSNIWGWKSSLTAVIEWIKTQLNTKHKGFINLEEKQQKKNLRFFITKSHVI